MQTSSVNYVDVICALVEENETETNHGEPTHSTCVVQLMVDKHLKV